MNSISGVGPGGARIKAASTIGRLVVLASQTICGSVQKPIPPNAVLKISDHSRKSRDIPDRVSVTF